MAEKRNSSQAPFILSKRACNPGAAGAAGYSCDGVFFSWRKLTRLGLFSECRKGGRKVRSTRTSTIRR